jgi:hypothetical protein
MRFRLWEGLALALVTDEQRMLHADEQSMLHEIAAASAARIEIDDFAENLLAYRVVRTPHR